MLFILWISIFVLIIFCVKQFIYSAMIFVDNSIQYPFILIWHLSKILRTRSRVKKNAHLIDDWQEVIPSRKRQMKKRGIQQGHIQRVLLNVWIKRSNLFIGMQFVLTDRRWPESLRHQKRMLYNASVCTHENAFYEQNY